MKHLTSEKGSIGELKISADLIMKGYPVFTPISATSPFDLLIFKDGSYLRIQVKYRKITDKGNINVGLVRNIISNSKITETYNSYVDIIAIYCPCTDKCYYVYEKDFSTYLTLRINKPKNNQVKNVRLAENYLEL